MKLLEKINGLQSLILVAGFFAPIAMMGTLYKSIPEWLVIVSFCIYSGCTHLFNFLQDPSKKTVKEVGDDTIRRPEPTIPGETK